MISSFCSRETEALYVAGSSTHWHPDLCRVAVRKLALLDSAGALSDLAHTPSLRLEKLRGDRRGRWSIRVNQQWRIVFAWGREGPEEVELVDYH